MFGVEWRSCAWCSLHNNDNDNNNNTSKVQLIVTQHKGNGGGEELPLDLTPQHQQPKLSLQITTTPANLSQQSERPHGMLRNGVQQYDEMMV